tara:strand:+ start:141 stop:560 length:420 start_codon:yes stop_codon:yes gene_type:complete
MNQNQKPVYVKSHRRGCKYCGVGKTYLTCNCKMSKRDRSAIDQRLKRLSTPKNNRPKNRPIITKSNSPLKKQPIITKPIPRKIVKHKKNKKLRVQKDIYGVMWAEFLSQRRNIYYWGNGKTVTWKLPLGWNPPIKSIYS